MEQFDVVSYNCSILLKSLSGRSNGTDVARVLALVDDLEKSVDEVLF